MAVAYVQEFAIVDGDTSTANYDTLVAELGLENAPDGLVVHSAGFDREKGVFRIFDVWESRQAGEQWMENVLNPVLERVMSVVAVLAWIGLLIWGAIEDGRAEKGDTTTPRRYFGCSTAITRTATDRAT
jgi:hypothetical protein